MIKLLQFVFLISFFGTFPVSAQISVGTSSQSQIGWSAYTKSSNRLTRVYQLGTSGENIVPIRSNGKFNIYGAEFKVNDQNNSFDYSSIANDNHSVTDSQQNSFSVFSSYNGMSLRSTKPSLGWFGKGNSSLSR